ncbi:hypothetical protein NPIL_667061, partial [Nephila pilipes]
MSLHRLQRRKMIYRPSRRCKVQCDACRSILSMTSISVSTVLYKEGFLGDPHRNSRLCPKLYLLDGRVYLAICKTTQTAAYKALSSAVTLT